VVRGAWIDVTAAAFREVQSTGSHIKHYRSMAATSCSRNGRDLITYSIGGRRPQTRAAYRGEYLSGFS
jgi:hypothetical protein